MKPHTHFPQLSLHVELLRARQRQRRQASARSRAWASTHAAWASDGAEAAMEEEKAQREPSGGAAKAQEVGPCPENKRILEAFGNAPFLCVR